MPCGGGNPDVEVMIDTSIEGDNIRNASTRAGKRDVLIPGIRS
jgi:hypothetical protein